MNYVRYYREYNKMSQRQLALYAKISHVELNHIENGRRTPNVYIAIRISKVLRIPVEGLFME